MWQKMEKNKQRNKQKTPLRKKHTRKEEKTTNCGFADLNVTRTPWFSPLHNSPDVLLIELLENY